MTVRPMTVRAGLLLGSMLAVLAFAPGAGAATFKSTGDGFRYTAGAGEANVLHAWTDGRTLLFTDTGAAAFDRALPSACTAVAAEVGIAASCNAPGDLTLRVDLGDGSDYLEAWELPRRVDLDVNTGDGENVVEGGSDGRCLRGRRT